MTDPVVLVERSDDGYAVVTLHRPEARNALNAALRAELHRVLRDLDGDESVAAVVLTGSDPAFCAGLDLKELAASPESLRGGFDDAADLRRPVPTMTKPLIGAVNGVAVTGGFELALACDFLVASEHARFADTHARVGIMPGWGLSVLLPQAVGVRRQGTTEVRYGDVVALDLDGIEVRYPSGRAETVVVHSAHQQDRVSPVELEVLP